MNGHAGTAFKKVIDVVETVVNRKVLPEMVLKKFRTENVRVTETEDGFHVTPVRDAPKSKFKIFGMFAGDPDLTVDKFLERKHAEKEPDL